MATPRDHMVEALRLARLAAKEGEVPVGAVLVLPDGRTYLGRNSVEANSPLDHAEMEVMGRASRDEGRHGLSGAVLYVTLEPCLMCLGAMVLARVGGLVYACEEPRFGGVALLRELWRQGRYPHRFPVESGLMEEDARALLQAFFRERRENPSPED